MSAYRLSVVGSVAPPGTAWDAEGLRGNEANKNKLMVLVRVQARKWQSGPVLHKRTSPVVSSRFGSPASNWESLVAYRLHAGIVEVETRSPITKQTRDLARPCRLRQPTVGPVRRGHDVAVNREAIADAARSLPFSAFLRQRQLVNRAQSIGPSAKKRYCSGIQRNFPHNVGHEHFEHDIGHCSRRMRHIQYIGRRSGKLRRCLEAKP
jgi:hypothetical protein